MPMVEPRPRIRSFRDLIVWQRAMELVREIYRLTEPFPKRELYGLTAQMRRAAVSIPANIAEGRGRFTGREYARFLTISTGSLRELDTYCEVSVLLGYATAVQLESVVKLVNEVGAMLAGLCRALRLGSRPPAGSRPQASGGR